MNIDMDSHMIWSPLLPATNLTNDQADLVERYNRVASEFFELNAIFEQLWRHQNKRKLWATPDVSKYIKE